MDQTPIQFRSAAEFDLLPGYAGTLTCTKEELGGIVGKYEWDEPRALLCGLNGCNRRHWHGWVIRTTDGRKTHCGRDCGEREFPVSFNEFVASFRRAEDEAARAANVADALKQRDEILQRAAKLEDQAASAAGRVREIADLINREPAYTKALADALRNGGRVQRAAKVDRELLAAMGQRTDKVSLETIGIISGGEALTQQREIVMHLRAHAIWPLRHLTAELLGQLNGKALAAKSAEITAARQALQDADTFIEIAARFTSPANRLELAKLAEVIPSRAKNQRVAKIASRLAMSDQTNTSAAAPA